MSSSVFSSLPNHLIMRIIKESTQEKRELDSWKQQIATINQIFIQQRDKMVEDWAAESYDGVLDQDDGFNESPAYFGLYFADTEKNWEEVVWRKSKWAELVNGGLFHAPISLKRSLDFISYK